MAAKKNTVGLLEAMEKNSNKIQNANALWNQRGKGVGVCQHPKGLLENDKQSDS